MWSYNNGTTGVTNAVTMPTDGIISVVVPAGVDMCAYVNDVEAPMHHLHIKAGDKVHFEVKGAKAPGTVTVEYGGQVHNLEVIPCEDEASHHEEKKSKKSKKDKGDKMSKKKEYDMLSDSNIFHGGNPFGGGFAGGGWGGGWGGAGAGAGAGLGAGILGGILGGALIGRRGLLGGDGDGDSGHCATPLAVQAIVNGSQIQKTLGDIQAAIPVAEGQSQLALAAAQSDIVAAITAATALVNGNLNTQALNVANQFAQTNQQVQATAAANLLATVNNSNQTQALVKDAIAQGDRNAWQLSTAIVADGDKTRALIASIDKQNDSRLITTLANEIIELRGDRRLAEATGNITISNTAVANAQQQQAQQQQQAVLLSQLVAGLNALVQQTNNVHQGMVNLGTMVGTTQASSNSNTVV